MVSIEKMLLTKKIPDELVYKIVQFSRPEKIDTSLKRSIEMFGTYKIIEGLKKLCDEEWEKYCLLWNSGDHSYNPQCMWHFIEYHYINLDTKCAKHLLKNLKRIRDDKTFLEKVSGNLHPEWVYEYKTKTYKKEMKMVESREIYKDIISYIECVQNHLDYIEQISYMDNDEYIYY